jgi:hypothetical protein
VPNLLDDMMLGYDCRRMRYRSFDLNVSFRLNLAPVLFRRYLSVFLSFHHVIILYLGGSVMPLFAWHGERSTRADGIGRLDQCMIEGMAIRSIHTTYLSS